MSETKIVHSGTDTFEFNVESKDSIVIQRHFTKHTERDIEIHSLPIPKRPIWLFLTVKLLRFYQKYISEKLGNRCVFDPSCSRYSEIAFRKYGFINGLRLSISRLRRCKPHNGGVDELE
jgi:putative membrane protein insertion efficiency factor